MSRYLLKKDEKMSDKKTYFQKLQDYTDKIKELKDWKSSSDDEETKHYLSLAIEKLLSEMKELMTSRGDDS